MLDNSLILSSSHLNQGIHDLWKYSVINMSNYEDTHQVGFIMNQQVLNFDMKLIPKVYSIEAPLPKTACPIYCGGPVSTDKITIIHSSEYQNTKTTPLNEYSSLTFNDQIFYDIEQGKGPRKWKIMLGYCAWLPGQLETEIDQKHSWMIADCDEYMWGNYKKKTKMWTRIVEKKGEEQASQFLSSLV
jgi:putative transcriptional regulator